MSNESRESRNTNSREFFFAMGGVYPPGRECYHVYSISDDPVDALESLRLQKQGCKLAHAYCDEGALLTNPPRIDDPLEPGKVLPGRRRMRRTKCP